MTDPDMLFDLPLFQAVDAVAENDEEALDAVMAHGYLTAQVISPEPDSVEQICATLFPEAETSGDSYQQRVPQVREVLALIDNQLNDGSETFTIPVEVDEDEDLLDSQLADWCAGFLEAHIEQEEAWLDFNEQAVAELLLPIAALSGVFAEEEEFQEINNNEALLEDMAMQLPEVLVELYLLMKTDG